MTFSQVSIEYDPATMCLLCQGSSQIELGVLSCCKKMLVHKQCWTKECIEQSTRKKTPKEVRSLKGEKGRQEITIGSPCCRDPAATFIGKQHLCRYCNQPSNGKICPCRSQSRSTRSQTTVKFDLPQERRPIEEVLQQNDAQSSLSPMKSNNPSSLERVPTQVVDLLENEEIRQLKEQIKQMNQALQPIIESFSRPQPTAPRQSFGAMQWNGNKLVNVTQQLQEMNLEQLKKDETWRCRTCEQRFSEIGWNTHSLGFPRHNVCDIYQISTGKFLKSTGPIIVSQPQPDLTPDVSEEVANVFDAEEDEKQRYTHLTQERRPRRNKPAAILKKQDLKEEKLHQYFIELIKSEFHLPLTELDWSFIAEFPLMKKGKAICNDFIDGLLFPESIGEGKSYKELKNQTQKIFINCGLSLAKLDQKKEQSYFKKKEILHRPFFAKLDDRGYDFTVKRISELQTAMGQLQAYLLKIDVTSDCEGCLFVRGVDKLQETKLATLLRQQHDFKVRKGYNQSPVCVSFERDDLYLTIYNKVVQRLEADLVTSKIGNGHQTILGSEAIAEKFIATQATSFFRIELRYRFDQEGIIPFSKRNPVKLQSDITSLLAKLRPLVYKALAVFLARIPVLWEKLWPVQSYFLIVSKHFATIVFGQDPYTSKYFGATYCLGKNKDNDKLVKKLLKVYGLVGRPGYVLHFQDQKRFKLQEWKKLCGNTALPLRTLFKETLFERVHLQGKTLADFGLASAGDLIFQPSIAGLLSSSQLQAGTVLYDSLSKSKLELDIKSWSTIVEKRYRKTKEAETLKRPREFIYIRPHPRRQILYLYNTKDTNTKFAYKLPTKQRFYDTMTALKYFTTQHPLSFAVLDSGAYVFHDFAVVVTSVFGELKFSKGNTDESSEDELVHEDNGDIEFIDTFAHTQTTQNQPNHEEQQREAYALYLSMLPPGTEPQWKPEGLRLEEEQVPSNNTQPIKRKTITVLSFDSGPRVELEKKKLEQRKQMTLGKRKQRRVTLENIGSVKQRTPFQQQHLSKPAENVTKRKSKQNEKETLKKVKRPSGDTTIKSNPTDRSKNRNKMTVCELCNHEMRADTIIIHQDGKACRKWQEENKNK